MRKLWKSVFSFNSTSYKIALRTARQGGVHTRASRYGKAMGKQWETHGPLQRENLLFNWIRAAPGLRGPRPGMMIVITQGAPHIFTFLDLCVSWISWLLRSYALTQLSLA